MASTPGTEVAAPSALGRDHADYLADGLDVPPRVGIRRVFLRQSRVSMVRDPVFLDDARVLFVAKVQGVLGLWQMDVAGNAPATLVVARPFVEPTSPLNARNRPNWYIGTPRLFPDGTHVIFGGTSPNPYQRYTNVLGIAPVSGGAIAAVEISDVKVARTPDVHPDGKTLVFSSCEELRLVELAARVDQQVSSRLLLRVPRESGVHEATCTVFRPRFSPHGDTVVFELVGRFADESFRRAHDLPTPVHAADYLIEPWVVSLHDPTPRRLLSEAAFESIGGRLQTGGTQDPVYAPDGKTVAMSHGQHIVEADAAGKWARIVVSSGSKAESGERKLRYHESDPAFSKNGRWLVSASTLTPSDSGVPPGLSVLSRSESRLAPP